MTYSNRFVMCVLVDGQPQAELATNEFANNIVELPFNTEYSLRFRNKNNRRAVVMLFVDGENVSGSGYVIPANDYIDIHQHFGKGTAFKFVSLDSAEAVDAGKNGPNPNNAKGLIEARFYLEKEKPSINYTYAQYSYPTFPTYTFPTWPTYTYATFTYPTYYPTFNPSYISLKPFNTVLSYNGPSMNGVGVTGGVTFNLNYNDGCTVEGQKNSFAYVYESVDIDYNDHVSVKISLKSKKPAKKECCKIQVKPPFAASKPVADLNHLEEENMQLRRQIAELENKKLKEMLKKLQEE